MGREQFPQQTRLDPYLTPYTNIKLNWITDPNTRAKTKQVLEKNLEANLHDLRISNKLLGLTVKAWSTKGKT